ncbi:UDP-N-acetylglucosamine 4,6-dehydratase (inverting), partial [Candidatus Pelagibacter sp.]|nr:UDP-N-acetylglucosamine 4,6-dehydratase (inverting) [Candidatus Pelagibacter sp.]
FTEKILKKFPSINKIIIFSRDEFKQNNMSEKFNSVKEKKKLRFFLGDIRDIQRLKIALQDIDIVIHAAALKQVPAAEYNPIEFIKTNVLGAQNLVEACLDNKVKQLVALSTDKAAAPINLYGATKLCSDKLFTAANNIKGKQDIRFSVVRYGNVAGSRGSVMPLFISQKKNNLLKITDKGMTRFNISLDEGIETVLWTLKNMQGGEIVVPKLPSYRIMDLAKAISSKIKIKLIGKRPGEKIHEELITESDSGNTIDIGNYYLILPTNNLGDLKNFIKRYKKLKFLKEFNYSSGKNKHYLKVNELKRILEKLKNKQN